MFSYTEEELNSLSPNWRDVLINIDHNRLSYGAYAQANNIKLGTIKSRLHRARAKVMKIREQNANAQ